jgi:hypothetical protein
VRRLPTKKPLALVLAAALAAACASPPPAARAAPSGFVIPTDLPNGRIEITVATAYPRGAVATIPVAIVVTRGTITGPLVARVLASGINEGGKPAELLVRELAVTPQTVAAGRRMTTLTWDTRDTNGTVVPADAYALVVEVRSEDAGTTRALTATATLELR